MQEIIDFLAKKEVFIIFIILLIAISLYIILWVIAFIKKKDEKKKLKTNTQELTKLAEKVKLLEKEQQEAALPPVFRIEQEKVREEIKPLVMEKKKEEEPKVVVKETFTSPITITPVVTEVVMPKKEENVITKEIKLNDNSMSEVEILDANPLEITYKNEVYTKEEAKEELKKLERQLIEQDKKEEKPIFEPREVKEVTNDEVIPVLDEVLDTKQENISLTNFEEDQEQNAIISLDELLKRGKTITQDEIVKHEDDGNEPITLQELEAKWKKDQEVVALKEEEIEVLDTSSKEEVPFSYEDIKVEAPKVKIPTMDELFSKSKTPYKPTPVISPIFGIEEDKISNDNSLRLENTANYDKLDAEIRKTNEFLLKLKELQKKLD